MASSARLCFATRDLRFNLAIADTMYETKKEPHEYVILLVENSALVSAIAWESIALQGKTWNWAGHARLEEA